MSVGKMSGNERSSLELWWNVVEGVNRRRGGMSFRRGRGPPIRADGQERASDPPPAPQNTPPRITVRREAADETGDHRCPLVVAPTQSPG